MIEPQLDGCLHWHIMLYSSVLSLELVEKVAAATSKSLQSQIGTMLDSITCTTVPCDIHQWYNDILSSVKHGSKQPRGADRKIPDASSNYEDFLSIGMKKSILTNMHGHRFCCEKGKRGKYICHLVFKQGLHKLETCPPLIVLFRLENIAKKNMQMYELTPWMKIPLLC